MSLSVSIVCKNSAATIGRTLESVRGLADEIVAVDSGSTDGTLELLEAAGARVIRSDWLGFLKTKQMAMDACKCAWVLCLDSDESPDATLATSVREVIKGWHEEAAISGYEINRLTYYRDRPLRHVWQPEWILRLVRRDQARWGGLDPHAAMMLVSGRSARLEGNLRHDSFPTFVEHFRRQCAYSATMAQTLHARGKRGSYLRLATSPTGAFLKQLVLKRGFVDGYAGWLAAASTACGALMKHAALIELDRSSEPRR